MTGSGARLVPVMGALAAALGLGIPGQASATFFTINFIEDSILQLDGSDDLSFTVCGTTTINPTGSCPGGLLTGTIRAIDIFSGITASDIDPLGSVGTVDFGTQDVFFFEVVLNDPSAPMDEIGLSIVSLDAFNNPKGAGYLKSPPVSNGDRDPLGVTVPMFTGLGLFDYDVGNVNANNLEAGQTSRILFVTYGLGDLQIGQPATFMISTGGGNDNFTVPIIPEPSAVLLLGAGLAAMGAARRRHLPRGR